MVVVGEERLFRSDRNTGQGRNVLKEGTGLLLPLVCLLAV